MKKKTKKPITPRLDMITLMSIKKRGGTHTPKKGGKYRRAAEKQARRLAAE